MLSRDSLGPLQWLMLAAVALASLAAWSLFLTTTDDSVETNEARAQLTPGSRAESTLELSGLTVRVADADAIPATSVSGRRRARMRVNVRVVMSSTATQGFVPNPDGRAISLRVGDRLIRVDPASRSAPGAARDDRPLAPGMRRAGDLRFELAGSQTRELQTTRAAELIVVGPPEERPGAPPPRGAVRIAFPPIN